MKTLPRVVIDTNVLVAALRSRQGASYRLLSRTGQGAFQHVVTVPLVMEYDDVLLRPDVVPLPAPAVSDVLDFVCATAIRQRIHFLWRPRLSEVKDDMVLEAAVNAQCSAIITWNVRGFVVASDLGLDAVTPIDFLNQL